MVLVVIKVLGGWVGNFFLAFIWVRYNIIFILVSNKHIDLVIMVLIF